MILQYCDRFSILNIIPPPERCDIAGNVFEVEERNFGRLMEALGEEKS